MLLCCGIVCFDTSLLLFPCLVLNICIFVVSIDILPRQNHPSYKFKSCWTFSSSRILLDLLVCIDPLYMSVFETCNCINYFTIYNNVFMIHLTDPKRFYMYLPCICKPIIIECLVFYPKAAKNGSNLHMHMFFKNGWQIPRVLGPHRCGCLGDVMDVM